MWADLVHYELPTDNPLRTGPPLCLDLVSWSVSPGENPLVSLRRSPRLAASLLGAGGGRDLTIGGFGVRAGPLMHNGSESPHLKAINQSQLDSDTRHS